MRTPGREVAAVLQDLQSLTESKQSRIHVGAMPIVTTVPSLCSGA